MGLYATGHLFFGVSYGDSDPRWPYNEYGDRERPDNWDDNDDDWEDWLMRLAGWESPYSDDKFPPHKPDHDWSITSMSKREAKYEAERKAWEAANSEWVQYREDWRAARETVVEQCPVELLYLGHYEWPQYALAICGTEVRGDYAGDPIPDGHPLFGVTTFKLFSAATAWCEEHGIDFSDPKWIIGSSYR